MPTSTNTLVQKVRAKVPDYGDALTTLSAAITDTTTTTITVTVGTDIESGYFILVDNEMMEVVSKSANTLTVVRGSRSTTAATHLINALVRVGVIFNNDEILDALNQALAAAYPKLYVAVADTTLTVVADQFDYNFPASTLDHLWRVEIESSDNTSQFFAIRNWDLTDTDTFHLYDDYAAGANIRLIGTKRFDALTLAGDLDTDYPTNQSAIDYLITDATGTLLIDRQNQVSRRDGFVGLTDSFGQSQPEVSFRHGLQLKKLAQRLLEDGRMVPPDRYTAHPARRYWARH